MCWYRMFFFSSFEKLSDQLLAQQKPYRTPKFKWSYLARAEPNYIFRWSLTLLLAIAYLVRIFYFETTGYTLLSFFLVLFLLQHVCAYRVSKPDLSAASDEDYLLDTHSGKYEPAIAVFFRREFSPPEFDAFVHRVLEFSFWYTATKAIFIALLLTWFTLISFPSIGPAKVLMAWCVFIVASRMIEFARFVAEKFRKPKKDLVCLLPVSMPDKPSMPSSGCVSADVTCG